jgi:hypothetical protein
VTVFRAAIIPILAYIVESSRGSILTGIVLTLAGGVTLAPAFRNTALFRGLQSV